MKKSLSCTDLLLSAGDDNGTTAAVDSILVGSTASLPPSQSFACLLWEPLEAAVVVYTAFLGAAEVAVAYDLATGAVALATGPQWEEVAPAPAACAVPGSWADVCKTAAFSGWTPGSSGAGGLVAPTSSVAGSQNSHRHLESATSSTSAAGASSCERW